MSLLPVTETIKVKDVNGRNEFINAGQGHISFAPKNSVIEIENPFETELVNFLQVRIKTNTDHFSSPVTISDFDPDGHKNSIVEITLQAGSDPVFPFSCFIGKFTGRTELIYKLENVKAGFFVYVIEGAFEVQNRLLHAKDGLSLWEASAIEAEALSNDAIQLIIELSV